MCQDQSVVMSTQVQFATDHYVIGIGGSHGNPRVVPECACAKDAYVARAHARSITPRIGGVVVKRPLPLLQSLTKTSVQ